MSQVSFIYNGNKTNIQCNENEKMKDICQRFVSKIQVDKNKIYFSYDGKAGNQFNEELTFMEMANSLDKTKKSMAILVDNLDDINEINESKNESIIKSKYIICPTCGETAKISIKNYKVSLYECKSKHRTDNLSFDEYEKTQNIDLSKIICNKCKDKNKYNSFNNEFFKCFNCNINLCPLCKTLHDTNHKIINYDEINYICPNHMEKFSKYCNQCNINICSICEEEEHSNHNTIYLGDIIKKKDLDNKMEKLKKDIEKCNNYINEIIEQLNKVKKDINKYYQIIINIVNKYDIRKKNYDILFNLKEISNNNDITEDINKINNENNIKNRFIHILNVYNKINNININDNNNIIDNNNNINDNINENINNNINTNNKNNEIKLTLKIEKVDINKDIYFLDNTNGKIFIDGKWEEHHHDCLEELNESNVELFINNIKYKYQKYFKPEKEGIYNIILKINIEIKDCSFMFYNCSKLTNIDLSSFNAKNVVNMKYMFYNCQNLLNVNLSSLDTKNVINMEYMFYSCKKLPNIDLSSFDTKNVTNMGNMFHFCQNLTDIDLTHFDTKKVTNLEYMFFECDNLTNIDISSFDIRNATKFNYMFSSCNKLKQIKLNKNSHEKIKNQIYNKKIDLITI